MPRLAPTPRTALVLALFAAALLAAPPALAADGSILYRKSGKLWVSSPDGSHKRAIPKSRGLESPSQDDRGNVVAQRGVMLYHLNRRGRQLNKPFTTPFRTNPIVTAFNGPFSPEVSPDGKTIAYTYSYTDSYYDAACDCVNTTPSFNTSYTSSTRATDNPNGNIGLARMYSHASWVDNRRVMFTTEHLYNFAGDALNTIAIDTLGGGEDSYDTWFSECVNCSDVQTLQMYPLDEGEMTRRHDKAVFVAGELGTKTPGPMMFIYPLSAEPPAIPQHFCKVTGASGKFSSPTWSPDGRSLAWADSQGVWVGTVGDLSGDECGLTKRLVIAGATSPDWGPKS